MEKEIAQSNIFKENKLFFNQNIIPFNQAFNSNTIINYYDVKAVASTDNNNIDNLIFEEKKKTNSTGVSSLNDLFLKGNEEGFLFNEDQIILGNEDFVTKELLFVEKTVEEKDKINKELLDNFLKKEKEMLKTQKKSLLSNKNISDTLISLKKISDQAKYVLNLNQIKKKHKFIIDI